MLIEIIQNASQELLGNQKEKVSLMRAVAQLVSDKKNMRRPKGRIGPSTLDGCGRRLFYEWRAYPWDKEPHQDPLALLMLQIRFLVHSYYQVLTARALELHGYTAVVEQAFDVKPFSGHLDLAFWSGNVKDRTLVEIKTSKNTRFEATKSPTSSMKKQLATYMQANKANKGIILFIDMETGDMKEWDAEPWYEIAQGQVAAKVNSVILADVQNQPLPAKRNRWNCSTCPFTVRCEADR